VLAHVNKVLTTELTREDVEGVYPGLRPLLSGESDETSKLSREHVVAHVAPGLVVVAGGKYTTYRVMAKDAVDAAVHGLDRRAPASCTETVPLIGADGYPALWKQPSAASRAASGLHVARIEHLLRRYGSLTEEVLALIDKDRDLAQPLDGADDYLRAEVVYAASYEGALHLEDVLARRMRVGLENLRPRRRLGSPRGRADGRGPRLGRRPHRARDRPLHTPPRSPPSASRSCSPTTAPPTAAPHGRARLLLIPPKDA